MNGFLILVVLAAVFWLVFVLPRRRSQQQHAAMQDSVDVGDEIITAGGLHAVVREIGDDQLKIEIAPEVIATLDRRAVAAVAREVEVEVEPETGTEADPEADPQAG